MIVTDADIRVALGIEASITDNEHGVLVLCHAWCEGLVKRFLSYDPEYKTHTSEIYPRTATGDMANSGGDWTANASGTRAVFERSVVSRAHETLQLRHLPIRSITSIYEDWDARYGSQSGAFAAGTLLTAGDDYAGVWDGKDSSGNYFSRSGQVRRYGGTWPTDPGTVSVTYVAGYTQKELSGYDDVLNASSIKMAVIQETVTNFRRWWARRKNTNFGFLAGVLQSERMGDYSYTLGGNGSSAVQELGFSVSLTSGSRQMLQPFRHYGLIAL